MQVTYEIKVYRNVSDNHKYDLQYTFYIKKNNDSFYSRFDAKNESIREAQSLNNDNDFNYCTYSADIESVTLKY